MAPDFTYTLQEINRIIDKAEDIKLYNSLGAEDKIIASDIDEILEIIQKGKYRTNVDR